VKVTNEKTENRQAFLTVELEPAEVEEFLGKAYKRMVNRVNVPGFRKGKAPRDIFERFVGREGLLDEAARDMVPDAYEKALKSEGLEAVARPQIEVATTEPFVFKAVVPLPPVVKLGDYHQIRVAEEPVSLSEDQVNNMLESLRHQHALWEPVERAADFNDQVIFNIKSDIDGMPFINRLGMQYQLLNEQTFPVPGFAAQVVGMKVGDTRQFKLSLPQDYGNPELAGKEVSFEITVNEVKQEKLPELNDEFAAQVDKEFKTMANLRDKAREELKKQLEEKAKREYEQKVVDELVRISEVEYPPAMLESEIDRMVSEHLRRFQLTDDRLADYLKAVNKTAEQLRQELTPAATKNLLEAVLVGEVAKIEKVDFSDAEVDAEVTGMAGAMSEENREKMRQFFNEPDSRQSIRRLNIGRKTVDKLVEIARGPAAVAGQTGKEEQK
jgi:trigger factor